MKVACLPFLLLTVSCAALMQEQLSSLAASPHQHVARMTNEISTLQVSRAGAAISRCKSS